MPRIRHFASNALMATLAFSLLAGCASTDPGDTRRRAPLAHLGYSAAETVLEAPAWPGTDRIIFVAPVEIKADFGPDAAQRYSDALMRGLLSVRDGPQVLPSQATTDRQATTNGTRALPRNHWRLTSQLDAPLGPITLSDRRLYPYTLTLELYRAGGTTPWWQTRLEGALDGRGLSTGTATGLAPAPESGSGAASATPATDAP